MTGRFPALILDIEGRQRLYNFVPNYTFEYIYINKQVVKVTMHSIIDAELPSNNDTQKRAYSHKLPKPTVFTFQTVCCEKLKIKTIQPSHSLALGACVTGQLVHSNNS